MEEIINGVSTFAKSLDLGQLMGKKTISPRGEVIGKIIEIRANPKNGEMLGILINRGLFKEKLYIDRDYFEKLSSEAIILNVEPFILLKSKKVITSDGEILGKVKSINRVDKTNQIKSLIVKKIFRKQIVIPLNSIKFIENSVVLKDSYNATKNL